MKLLRLLVRFFVPQLFTQLSPSCWCTTTHRVTQTILKRIYSSPSALQRLHRFFKSIPWITSSSAMVTSFRGGRTSVNTCKNQIGEFTDRPFPHCVTSSWPHNLTKSLIDGFAAGVF